MTWPFVLNRMPHSFYAGECIPLLGAHTYVATAIELLASYYTSTVPSELPLLTLIQYTSHDRQNFVHKLDNGCMIMSFTQYISLLF